MQHVRRNVSAWVGYLMRDFGGFVGAAVAAQEGPVRTAAQPAIRAVGLTMRYGSNIVLHGIDLDVATGEIFAFLGPNGAGKTTTVEILEGFRKRTEGRVAVLGADPDSSTPQWRARIGVVLQACIPEPDLTVQETVTLYAGFYDAPLPTKDVLELTGLADIASTLNRRLSGGQQRRLDVALALIGNPDLIFLDEPTTGFDPAARRAAWQVISDLRSLGKTIFLTTHYLEEAEVLADRIAVIRDGRIVARGTPDTLGGRDHDRSLIQCRVDPSYIRNVPATWDATIWEDGSVVIKSADPLERAAEMHAWATANEISVRDLQIRRPTLEDVYLALTTNQHD